VSAGVQAAAIAHGAHKTNEGVGLLGMVGEQPDSIEHLAEAAFHPFEEFPCLGRRVRIVFSQCRNSSHLQSPTVITILWRSTKRGSERSESETWVADFAAGLAALFRSHLIAARVSPVVKNTSCSKKCSKRIRARWLLLTIWTFTDPSGQV